MPFNSNSELLTGLLRITGSPQHTTQSVTEHTLLQGELVRCSQLDGLSRVSRCEIEVSGEERQLREVVQRHGDVTVITQHPVDFQDRKSTRLNSSHVSNSYAV